VARLYGVANHEALAQPLLEELEIADRANQLPGELSRGMKQKVSIACGLLHSHSRRGARVHAPRSMVRRAVVSLTSISFLMYVEARNGMPGKRTIPCR
jgi:hypothetical protein